MKATVKKLAATTFLVTLLFVGNLFANNAEGKTLNAEIIESTLDLENWMTNEAVWNTNFSNALNITQEAETNLELESWMLNNSTWNSSYNIATVNEANMELESWMINEKIWEVEEKVTEEKLTLASWMIDGKVWN